MKNATVIFGPGVDAAIVNLIDYVDLDDIPTVVTFLERIQQRLVGTLSAYPEGGSRFQGDVRMMGFCRKVLPRGRQSLVVLEACLQV